EAEREDGVFPLLTNDRKLSATEVLRAYKRQPLLEKRFSQFKTDFAVAPVYLKNVSRIQGLLAAYFFVLLVQTLLERELRQGMARAGEKSLPLYPEDRPCARPTTHRLIEVFSSIQRHEVRVREGETQVMVTKLTKNATLDHSTTGPRPEDLRAGVAECPAPEKMPGNWNDDLRKVRGILHKIVHFVRLAGEAASVVDVDCDARVFIRLQRMVSLSDLIEDRFDLDGINVPDVPSQGAG